MGAGSSAPAQPSPRPPPEKRRRSGGSQPELPPAEATTTSPVPPAAEQTGAQTEEAAPVLVEPIIDDEETLLEDENYDGRVSLSESQEFELETAVVNALALAQRGLTRVGRNPALNPYGPRPLFAFDKAALIGLPISPALSDLKMSAATPGSPSNWLVWSPTPEDPASPTIKIFRVGNYNDTSLRCVDHVSAPGELDVWFSMLHVPGPNLLFLHRAGRLFRSRFEETPGKFQWTKVALEEESGLKFSGRWCVSNSFEHLLLFDQSSRMVYFLDPWSFAVERTVPLADGPDVDFRGPVLVTFAYDGDNFYFGMPELDDEQQAGMGVTMFADSGEYLATFVDTTGGSRLYYNWSLRLYTSTFIQTDYTYFGKQISANIKTTRCWSKTPSHTTVWAKLRMPTFALLNNFSAHSSR